MALLDAVSSLVTRYNVGPLTVHRPGPGVQNAYGDYTDAAAATITIDPVAVHTATGRALLQVPEADRTIETIELYTNVRLYLSEDGQVADRVEYRDRTFRVVHVDDYDLQGGIYLALAQLEEVTS